MASTTLADGLCMAATYDHDNIFAKIIRGDIESEKVYEDPYVIAIKDISPAAPVHVLIMPTAKYISYDDFILRANNDAIAHFFKAIGAVAKKLGVCEGGYRLITNHGADASQSVPHFHVHLLAGTALGALLPGDTVAR